MSQAWRHALDPCRWPLELLELEAGTDEDAPSGPPPAALWAQCVWPGVRRLDIHIGTEEDFWDDRSMPLQLDSPEAQAIHGALLSIEPASVSGLGWCDRTRACSSMSANCCVDQVGEIAASDSQMQ